MSSKCLIVCCRECIHRPKEVDTNIKKGDGTPRTRFIFPDDHCPFKNVRDSSSYCFKDDEFFCKCGESKEVLDF